jgi:hypothetical protein
MRRRLPKAGRKKKILLEELSALDIIEEEMALGKGKNEEGKSFKQVRVFPSHGEGELEAEI